MRSSTPAIKNRKGTKPYLDSQLWGTTGTEEDKKRKRACHGLLFECMEGLQCRGEARVGEKRGEKAPADTPYLNALAEMSSRG